MPVLIALAEDNAVNRSTFHQKMQQYSNDVLLVFSSVNGHDCLEQLKGLPLKQLPRVIFVDLEMPGMNGIQTIQLAKSLYPQIQFIVLTVFDDEEKIFEAIRAGAAGYLLKDESAAAIRNAVFNVTEFGGAPMSPAIARKALEMLSRSHDVAANPAKQANEIETLLSQREKEILHLTIQGHDAKRVAEILNISVLTVRKHVANIYQRLHVNSKAQIINLAHERKWFG